MSYVIGTYLFVGFMVFFASYSSWNISLAKSIMWPITFLICLLEGIVQVIDEYLR